MLTFCVEQSDVSHSTFRNFNPIMLTLSERQQTEVIERILRHGGLWDEPSARAPPSTAFPVEG